MQRFFLFGSLGLLGGIAFAAAPKPNPARDNGTDVKFMTTLAQAGVAEIQAGQVAIMRGDKFDREYGRQMTHDHQRLAAQLMKIAQNRDVTLASTADPKDAKLIHRLEHLSGAKFATRYHHFAVASHRGAIGLFRDEIAHGKDAGLKAWARKTLPTIERHYSEARAMKME